jgi:hypothetical protein
MILCDRTVVLYMNSHLFFFLNAVLSHKFYHPTI